MNIYCAIFDCNHLSRDNGLCADHQPAPTSAIHMTPDHHYSFTHADGRTVGPYPGVTGLLPTKDLGGWQTYMAARRAIDTWGTWAGMEERDAVRHIQSAADDYRDAAADLGSRVHAWCEKRVLHPLVWKMAVPDDAEIRGHAREFEKFLADWNPRYTHVERTVFSETHGYAGTFDAICHIDGLGRVLLDIKSGRTVRGETAMQLAAYASADYIANDDGTTELIGHIDNYVVLHLRPRSHHLVPMAVTLPDTFNDFLYSKEVHRINAAADRLVGPELFPSLGEVA